MKVAIVGSRGIPANYGGFETFAEELSTRLVKQSHEVIVACEWTTERPANYRGVQLTHFPLRPPKSYSLRKVYEIANDIWFMTRLARKSDAMCVLGVGANLFLGLPKLLNPRGRLIINIDGLEWKREKFSRIEKWILKFSFACAYRFADEIILDAEALRHHLPEKHQADATYIPYGVSEFPQIPWDKELARTVEERAPRLALDDRSYWLIVARLEPENNIHVALEGFLRSRSKLPLMVVGNFTNREYEGAVRRIVESQPGRIFLTGGIYDRQLLNMLRLHARGYIHGHSVGGTNPSLLEAMIMRNIIVAHDNEFNREVCGETARYFHNSGELSEQIDFIEANADKSEALRELADVRVRELYDWRDVVNAYEKSFRQRSGDHL